MTASEKLAHRLNGLTENEREVIAEALLEVWDELAWERQLLEDQQSGKLDAVIERVSTNIDKGRFRPL